MIYHLSNYLKTAFNYNTLNLFRYISVRTISALLTALILSFILGKWFINHFQQKFGSKVREYTPENHLKKNDTPTMGGILIFIVFLINTLLWNDLSNSNVWIFAACLFIFGIIGLFDDLAKIKKSKGISAKLKFNLQILAGLIIMTSWYFISHPNTELCIPFLKKVTPILGWLIIPWGAFILISLSNAVNLTDGLDGLATGPLIFNFSAFSIIAYLAGHAKFASYLFIPFANSSEMVIIAATLIGTLIGFLWYNTYPAQIFMGDVGSLALGAGLAMMALMARQEMLILIAGGLFIAETLSVIIQVVSFKTTGKRVFKMAPIHHHFELMGWSEPKITIRFWIISLILSILSILTLKIR